MSRFYSLHFTLVRSYSRRAAGPVYTQPNEMEADDDQKHPCPTVNGLMMSTILREVVASVRHLEELLSAVHTNARIVM